MDVGAVAGQAELSSPKKAEAKAEKAEEKKEVESNETREAANRSDERQQALAAEGVGQQINAEG
ncbi:hypothetical protein BVY02_01265 [bacterium J17]|nr:hypothetical protein BVY02_01265 [bacterium J17]